ncbi:DUF3159 domain-containing protein [Pseudonocardia sp. EC080610-09]|uniref:DUF3159 domain-containing protein n=1 Tax=Pseudonocardia sp. EC080610-09 TaxID=1688404 RepID=UPI0011AE1AB5|nr:DUF3159 domain-containing protein [Pseudonocardia sp. EC080610-09]
MTVQDHAPHRIDDVATRPIPVVPAAADAADATAATGQPKPTLLDQMGGPMGFVYSTLPVVVFVTANAFLSLSLTIAIAVGSGLALTVFRTVRGEKLTAAAGSLAGVAVAAGVVAWTGSAKDFFLIGIWAAAAGFLVTFGSVLARRPLSGLVWNAVHGGTHDWRGDRTVLRAHDVATLAAAAVFGARFVVKEWLYLADSTTWLAITKVAMGTPLTVLAALVVVWAFRRSTKQLIDTPA